MNDECNGFGFFQIIALIISYSFLEKIFSSCKYLIYHSLSLITDYRHRHHQVIEVKFIFLFCVFSDLLFHLFKTDSEIEFELFIFHII